MSDRVLLVTGASSGIGLATAEHAARAGFRVALVARSTQELEGLVDRLGGAQRALAITCDVRSWDDQQRMAAEALEHFGRLDAVFANAGRGGEPGGFTSADPEGWRDQILTNVYGCALTLRATIPALKETKGHLLMTSSVAGRVALMGSMYSATKWAVTAIGYNVREELRGTGVRVTLIEPGVVNTPFFDEPKEGALQAEDIARAVMYALEQPRHVDVNEIMLRPTPPE